MRCTPYLHPIWDILIKREDFRVWTAPGGRIEEGETAEEAAQREAQEETGFIIAIDSYLGEYWRPQLPNGGSCIQAFIGHVVEGKSGQPSWESVAVAWFSVDDLPRRTLHFAQEMIHDARFAVDRPVKRTQMISKWEQLFLWVGIALRNWRNRLRRPEQG